MSKDFSPTTSIYAFVSGKGGVGKTSICLNMAAVLAKAGKRILVLDGDFGLANVDVQLGIVPQKDISWVIKGKATLEEAMVKTEQGFYVIPGQSGGVSSLMTLLEQAHVLQKLKDAAGAFDAVFIDVAAGINGDVLSFGNFADHTVLVVSPDPSAVTDGYAVVKLLWQKYGKDNVHVLVNQAGGEQEGKNTFTKLKKAAKSFLGLDLPLLGIIPYDRNYAAAVKLQNLTTVAFPTSKASERLKEVAPKLLGSLTK